jgi:hypothetical protein
MTTDLELPCLALDSRRRYELEHACGKAADIPALLQQLADRPPSSGEGGPWFQLWSALAAKGSTDVAEAVLELTAAVAADFMEWQESR